MGTYVISDIHGEYNKFLEMLDKISFSDADTMYIIGDMIDRGKNSFEVVKHIMASPNMIAIKGNHEEMLMYAVNKYGIKGSIATSMLNGTDTFTTYKKFRKMFYKDIEEYRRVYRFLNTLPIYKYITVNNNDFLLVHAGIRSSRIEENTEDDMLWIREEFIQNPETFPFVVVFGHTPTSYIGEPGKIWKRDDRIGIDCGACFSDGTMACMRLDDFKEYYV